MISGTLYEWSSFTRITIFSKSGSLLLQINKTSRASCVLLPEEQGAHFGYDIHTGSKMLVHESGSDLHRLIS
jgi:hypothetical protein